MGYRLHDKLQQLEPYTVITEEYKVRLDANESFIDPGKELKERLLSAWGRVPLNRYPDDSYRELRRAFGEHYGVDPELVVAGNGSDELLSLLIGCFLKSDEKLLLTQPDFSMYEIFAANYEKSFSVISRTEDGLLDVSATLLKIKTEGVRALLFSNPSSATSTVNKRQDILKLVDNTHALVIVDEAYMDFSDQSVLQDAPMKDNLIVLRTCSKALGCAGIRLGFAVSSKKISHVIQGLRAPYNLNALSEATGRIVLSDEKYIGDSINRILVNRNALYEGLKALGQNSMIKRIFSSATNYICIETDFAEEIYTALKTHSILVRNLKTMLRITVGTTEENRAVLDAMREIVYGDREVIVT